MSTLATLETTIAAQLAGLLTANGGTLDTIIFEDAPPTADALGELLQRYGPRVNSAFVLGPSCQITKAGGPRVANVQASFVFLAVIPTRASSADRRSASHTLFDAFCAAMTLQRPARTGLNTTAPLDFIATGSRTSANSPEFATLAIDFSVTIRNWQINSPA